MSGNAMRNPDPDCDVMILGAGVSGLAAARALAGAGLRIRVLEARNRIGGRILTHRDSLLRYPIELGAEFIHGHPRETLDLVEENGLTRFDVMDAHLRATANGPKQADEFWGRIQNVMARLNTKGPDRSFAEFLRSELDLDPDTRDLAQAFVEGFHAADARYISEQGLADAEQATDDQTGAEESSRLFEGYDEIPKALLRGQPLKTTALHLNTVAREIHWRKGRVDVVTESASGAAIPRNFSAPKLLVTLPWGVLQASPNEPASVRFDPEPYGLREARTAIRMGSALRIVLQFRERFWESLTDEPISYLHGDSRALLPTWWTPMPSRAPLFVGWAGGPKAETLSQMSEARIIESATETLGSLLGITGREVKKHLQSWHFHDWQNDPFARGAYSYLAVGGTEAAKHLSEPADGTLFFAGEATRMGSTRGTVDGAIASGYRAAAQIMEAMLG